MLQTMSVWEENIGSWYGALPSHPEHPSHDADVEVQMEVYENYQRSQAELLEAEKRDAKEDDAFIKRSEAANRKPATLSVAPDQRTLESFVIRPSTSSGVPVQGGQSTSSKQKPTSSAEVKKAAVVDVKPRAPTSSSSSTVVGYDLTGLFDVPTKFLVNSQAPASSLGSKVVKKRDRSPKPPTVSLFTQTVSLASTLRNHLYCIN